MLQENSADSICHYRYWLPDIKVAQFSLEMILVKFFPKNATFKLSLMSNDEQKKIVHFCILHIINIWFLLNLELALVTTFEMKFELVWPKTFFHELTIPRSQMLDATPVPQKRFPPQLFDLVLNSTNVMILILLSFNESLMHHHHHEMIKLWSWELGTNTYTCRVAH